MLRLLPVAAWLLWLLGCSLPGNAQKSMEEGVPLITNYYTKDYKAPPQVWCIQQGDNGLMYFGCQNVIVEYDGVKWKKIPAPKAINGEVFRSFAKSSDGTIYYGGFGDIGYIAKDSEDHLYVKSLLDLVPKEQRSFQDVWTTYCRSDGIYFQSREAIFRFSNLNSKNGKVTVKTWKPQTRFMFAFDVDGNYYVHQQGLGLFRMDEDSLHFIPGSEFMGKERMQVFLPYKAAGNEKQFLCGLYNSGLYLYNGKTFTHFATKADSLFSNGEILYKGIQLQNGDYALGTIGKGILIIDHEGNIIHTVDRSVGLQDATVHSMQIDRNGMLWLSLDNGISRVNIASPLTKFGLEAGVGTGVLAVQRMGADLYIGTTGGVRRYVSEHRRFEAVTGIPSNQIFSLARFGNNLLVPGDGLFAIRDRKAYRIQQSVGGNLTLLALHISNKNPHLVLAGGNNGIAVFFAKKLPDPGPTDWEYLGLVPGIDDQIWSVAENSDGTIWAGTQDSKVFKVTIPTDASGRPELKKSIVEEVEDKIGKKDVLGAVYLINGKNYFPTDSFFTGTMRHTIVLFAIIFLAPFQMEAQRMNRR